MNITQYLTQLNTRFKSGISREHSYRTDLESLIRELVSGVEITNEPANVTDCGNPDYVITRKKIPIGYIEAKDIDKDLKNKTYKEQFDRYKKALDNLVITNYLWFQFFQNGELIHEIRIGEIEGNKIIPLTENFAQFETLIRDFCTFVGQTIKSSKKLAEMMAAKARLLENILERAVTSDEENSENSSLKSQYETFKQILIHDLTPKGFADIYAQTLAYGMFAARLHDPSLENFSRQEAAELIPKTNPFLRKLFQYVAGFDIDERIKTTVDNLAEVFRATDVNALLHNFGKSTQTNDPIIHFYETFLSEYDPKLRKSRGVWYTPEPVVKFIVRAVDDILKTEFNLPDGVADTSKTKIKIKDFAKATADMRSKTRQIEREVEVHKVQILDPATGTGTFLAEVVKHIYSTRFQAMQGAWSGYVEEHLIPRLNGFEILMASYSMAHLKLDMLLTETGYKPKKEQRFNIYLTNSLEEHHPDTGTLFANWLSSEANEANHIKRDTPVMVVMGNPPYAVSSTNKGEWIQNLIADYKKDLNERKINLDDDYIKFIRYGQHFIDKNGSGVLAYISNNSFIDGITHRQMRKSLLESFDKIYILDLHGSAKKNETALDGSKDENVFDIQQGVSINIFVKTNEKKKGSFAEVNHFELFGLRDDKYCKLIESNPNSINWSKLDFKEPNYFFVPKQFALDGKYEAGISLSSLFRVFSTGIESKCDDITIQFSSKLIKDIVKDFIEKSESELQKIYKRENSAGWNYLNAKSDLIRNNPKIIPIAYRPFDIRFTAYSGQSSGFLGRPRSEMNSNLIQSNFAISSTRSKRNDSSCYFITKNVTDKSIASSLDNNYIFPLYLYPETKAQQTIGQSTDRTPNLNPEIVKQLADKLGLTFVPEKEPEGNVCFINNTEVWPDFRSTFAPIDILDYIYAVLHSPAYREKYKEFLKIDFPRVPYPKDAETFWQLVELGSEIRQIHLLESQRVNQFITSYPNDGSNEVTRKMTTASPGWEAINEEKTIGRVWINDQQHFDGVPLIAWEFYIGGYQPAQKWLKDRHGRTLNFEDILHYQKIIVALTETHRLMQEVDKIGVE
jgi:predicted helicase